ncbi:MAG: DUF2085 domain-containing protein [Epulopiscium sp.]|nr:DUF2085 domain-containing protein [Candidatus Epulonipiscium sp.]
MKELIYFMGRSVCHQFPERSFFIQGTKMPLCARCTGIYLGMFLGFLYLYFRRRNKGNTPPSFQFLIGMILCWIPMILDGVTSYMGFRETTNITRLLTGFLFGVFIPVFIVLLKNFDLEGENNIPIIKGYKDLLFMVLLFFFSIIIITMDYDIVWWIVSGITVLTISYVYMQISYIIIRQILESISKKRAYYIALATMASVIIILSVMNELLLAKYR